MCDLLLTVFRSEARGEKKRRRMGRGGGEEEKMETLSNFRFYDFNYEVHFLSREEYVQP